MTAENADTPRYTPPWTFGISNIPYGVAGTYSGVAVPFLLRKEGLPVETIAAIGALCMLPAAYQLFWAPIIDLGIRRRSWLILCSTIGSVLLAASLLISPKQHLLIYEIVLVAGQLFTGLVASCNGALVSTTVDPNKRGRAAGFINAANLGAAALGGGMVLQLANNVSHSAAAIGIFLVTMLPSLIALTIKEAPPMKDPILEHLGNMRKEVWRAVKARRGWTGLVFCLSPVGTVALTNLFSGMGADYHVKGQVIELVNGYGGGFITAAGALASGFILDRVDRRKMYLLSGILTALCCCCMALAPINQNTYIVGTMFYLLIAGLSYASFSAIVYEIVGTAGSTASTLYSVFPAAGNMAITYTLFFDGQANKAFGAHGVLWTDAGMNMLGVLFLFLILKMVFKEKNEAKTETTSEPAFTEAKT